MGWFAHDLGETEDETCEYRGEEKRSIDYMKLALLIGQFLGNSGIVAIE